MISREAGLWAEPGVPHLGWECRDVEILDADRRETCQMCGVQQIRFIHCMWHPTHPETLRCGCDCAGYMSGDMDGARTTQAQAEGKVAALERLKDVTLDWRQSYTGNLWFKRRGWRGTAFLNRNKRWGFAVTDPTGATNWGPRYGYPTQTDAVREATAAFIAMLRRLIMSS